MSLCLTTFQTNAPSTSNETEKNLAFVIQDLTKNPARIDLQTLREEKKKIYSIYKEVASQLRRDFEKSSFFDTTKKYLNALTYSPQKSVSGSLYLQYGALPSIDEKKREKEPSSPLIQVSEDESEKKIDNSERSSASQDPVKPYWQLPVTGIIHIRIFENLSTEEKSESLFRAIMPILVSIHVWQGSTENVSSPKSYHETINHIVKNRSQCRKLESIIQEKFFSAKDRSEQKRMPTTIGTSASEASKDLSPTTEIFVIQEDSPPSLQLFRRFTFDYHGSSDPSIIFRISNKKDERDEIPALIKAAKMNEGAIVSAILKKERSNEISRDFMALALIESTKNNAEATFSLIMQSMEFSPPDFIRDLFLQAVKYNAERVVTVIMKSEKWKKIDLLYIAIALTAAAENGSDTLIKSILTNERWLSSEFSTLFSNEKRMSPQVIATSITNSEGWKELGLFEIAEIVYIIAKNNIPACFVAIMQSSRWKELQTDQIANILVKALQGNAYEIVKAIEDNERWKEVSADAIEKELTIAVTRQAMQSLIQQDPFTDFSQIPLGVILKQANPNRDLVATFLQNRKWQEVVGKTFHSSLQERAHKLAEYILQSEETLLRHKPLRLF